jgi:hypothetical protein
MVTVLLFIASLFPAHYYAQFDDVSEIKSGMTVIYRGIAIGRVGDMDLGPGGKPLADLKIERRYRTYMREGCAVRLRRDEGRLVDQDKRLLESYATIPGLAGAGDYFRFGLRKVGEGLRDLKIKDQLDRLSGEMDEAWNKGKEEFQRLWPEFKQELRDLKEKMTDEKAVKDVERMIDEGDEKAK